MKTPHSGATRKLGLVFALAIIATAVGLTAHVIKRQSTHPASDDASLDAEVTHIAAAVGGRIQRIAVTENQAVKAGDVLFEIDPHPFQLSLDQARAELKLAEAALESKRHALAVQQSTARVAGKQTTRAETNLALAHRTVERLRPLAEKGYVPQQQLDQAMVAERDAETSLQQAREQASAATVAIDSEASAEAAVKARQAAVALAERALADTTVRAAHAGRVAGLTVTAGEMIAPQQSLFTLINTDEWFAVAHFREHELKSIQPGTCATVYSMIDREHPIKGVVQGIGWGVLEPGHLNLPRSLPYVERSLNWVRVAQRFPVRIELEHPPQHLTRMGASAVVEVGHGAACK
ncbi:multidrug transporter subunit MdtN [Burkholderiaceae bacterium DAT-1]|nr:multidrug transporter subunit MdtN [Burkholderiaceae bacterium DAT-1]